MNKGDDGWCRFSILRYITIKIALPTNYISLTLIENATSDVSPFSGQRGRQMWKVVWSLCVVDVCILLSDVGNSNKKAFNDSNRVMVACRQSFTCC